MFPTQIWPGMILVLWPKADADWDTPTWYPSAPDAAWVVRFLGALATRAGGFPNYRDNPTPPTTKLLYLQTLSYNALSHACVSIIYCSSTSCTWIRTHSTSHINQLTHFAVLLRSFQHLSLPTKIVLRTRQLGSWTSLIDNKFQYLSMEL